ncbi:MAG: D-isomer specific 2-hydroxyacid dehydrogenase NAD-binding protein [Proteobacteria bacterium]|nr:D-isomer specific 2-hydroxyacid dehydrogenase NAD-binding protein [Pseudomonadota bacterium]
MYLTFSPSGRALYYGDKALAGLRELGELRLNEREDIPAQAELIDAAHDCQVLISDRRVTADAALFAALPQLAVLMRCAMDIRNIDVAAASAAGVLVTRASAGFGNSVAEWVLGVMIDGARGISRSVQAYRSGATPAIAMGRELRGSRVGIIGYGHIGRRLGELALALGMHVAISDPRSRPDDARIEALPLDTLLAQSDFVVCLAPAVAETENLMNAAAYARMPPGAFFVNASRGNLVDEPALLAALDTGHLVGCALDVGRAADQMPSAELAAHPKVIATPHIGGLTPPAAEHQALETVAQLAALLRGEMPAGAVNEAQATRLAAWRALHT